MRPRAQVAVGYGLLCVLLAAQAPDTRSHQPCSLEKFGLDESCHDCRVFHVQMLEDGVNLTARCGWPPEGSAQRPPSEFANRSFNVGKRSICESCNDFHRRLLGGSPPFNLTEKCGWQIAASIVDDSQPTIASPADSDACLAYKVFSVVSGVINAVVVIYCCVMRNRKCFRKGLCQKCVVCGLVAPTSRLKKVVVVDSRRPSLDEPSAAAAVTSSLMAGHQSTNGSTNAPEDGSSSSATFSNSSKLQGSHKAKKSAGVRRRKTN